MRQLLSALLIILSAGALNARPKPARQPGPILIEHVTVIDMTGAAAQPDMTVVIRNGRISALGKAGKVRVPKGARVVSGSGKFLIPGLWDMHAHLVYAGESALPLFITNGVTGVRDMGGQLAAIQAWRRKFAAGKLAGPRIKAAGSALESASFVKHVARIEEIIRSHNVEPLHPQTSRLSLPVSVATEDEARRAVRSHVKSGVDFIKARTFESRETYFAIAAEAKRLGAPFVGHVATPMVSLAEASDAGQRSFEHMFYIAGNLDNMTDAQRRDLYARFVRNGTWLVPTITPERIRTAPDDSIKAEVESSLRRGSERGKYLTEQLAYSFRRDLKVRLLEHSVEAPEGEDIAFQKNLQYLRAMHLAGVKMMPGTDLGGLLVFPGFSLHDELEQLVKDVGMTPMQALQSATRSPAEFFGMLNSLGTVEEGKIADLVLLDANPLEDIRNTRKINAVVADGRLLDRRALDKLLADAEAAGRGDSRVGGARGGDASGGNRRRFVVYSSRELGQN